MTGKDLEDYTKKVQLDLIANIWLRCEQVIDVRGQFFYVDLSQILQDTRREILSEQK